MKRIVLALALATLATAASAAQEARVAPVQPVNAVVRWNQILLSIIRTPGAQPATMHSTRAFAMMHAAIFDAVNSIDRRHRPYIAIVDGASKHASASAAASTAAHDVLVALYPAFASTLDDALAASLFRVGRLDRVADGVRIGRRAASQTLAVRSTDGADRAPLEYVFGTAPGDYQKTPPNFPAQPQLTQWPFVTPFVLRQADQFRPAAPPPLDSAAYAAAFDEVATRGVADGHAATADQMLTGQFWNGSIQNYWNEIAQTTATRLRLDVDESARLFALLNLSLADGAIAFYDAKYRYNLWRPVTAIRGADADLNPLTAANDSWLPLVGKTPPDPSYPGAHAVVSAAAATVLRTFVHRGRFAFDVTSEVLPDVQRSFTSFEAAAIEASTSRIFAGVHFRFDHDAGFELGVRVAEYTLTHALESVREHREW